MSAKTLSLFEEIPGFVRIHKGCLINVAYIDHLHVVSPKEAFVVLKSGVKFAVSRRRIVHVSDQIRLSGKAK